MVPRRITSAFALAAAAALMSQLPVPTATAADSRGLTVSISFASSGRYLADSLDIEATNGAAVGPADVIVEQEAANQMWVHIDRASAATPILTAGPGCTDGSDLGLSVYCSISLTTVVVDIDLTNSQYAGGELIFVNKSTYPASFTGSPYADYFEGGGGADSMDGGGGAENLFGGDGDDWMLGGDGPDKIYGDNGNDTIFGDLGADYIDVEGGSAAEADVVNCNNFLPSVQNTDNDPAFPPINVVDFDKGRDRITDCGLPGAPTVVKEPSISGNPRLGTATTASPGTWTGDALRMSYAWFACPTADDTVPEFDEIPPGACAQVFAQDGVKGLTYRPKAADVGTFLRLRATARNNAGFAVAVSPASEQVLGATTPGAVGDVTAKVKGVKGPNGRRYYSLRTTWSPPVDVGPGVKDYVIQFVGLAAAKVTETTRQSEYEFTLTRYPRGGTVTIRVAARGPDGASQQGPWSAPVSVTLPRR